MLVVGNEAPAIRKLTLLNVNIGRGHPFYLDGIAECLIRSGQVGLIRNQFDALEISRGLSHLGWQGVRWLYQHGPSSRLAGAFYAAARSGVDYNRPSLSLSLLGRDIKERFRFDPDPIVVSHPTLVGILAGHPELHYQHGELAVPPEAVVRGARQVFVPTPEAAQPFLEGGYRSEQVVVTGLCIEPAIVRQASDAYAARLQRLEDGGILTGAYFSSGAEPEPHVKLLVQSAASAIENAGQALIFARRGGRLARAVTTQFRRFGIPLADLTNPPGDGPEPGAAWLIETGSRREEGSLVARLFPTFDYIMAPSHERTNWGIGLGLPYFLLDPPFGPYAPLNRHLLLSIGAGLPIATMADAAEFGEFLGHLLEAGQIMSMATAGTNRHEIDGFGAISDLLVRRYGERRA